MMTSFRFILCEMKLRFSMRDDEDEEEDRHWFAFANSKFEFRCFRQHVHGRERENIKHNGTGTEPFRPLGKSKCCLLLVPPLAQDDRAILGISLSTPTLYSFTPMSASFSLPLNTI